MPDDDLIYMGNQIHAARKACNLTQQELADQAGLAVKTIQDIEHGVKNPTYETISAIIRRLGISANSLFPIGAPVEEELLLRFVGKFQSCTPEHQKVLLNTLEFLAEQLRSLESARK